MRLSWLLGCLVSHSDSLIKSESLCDRPKFKGLPLFLKIKLATVDSKECSRGFANALTAYGTRDRRTDANKGINYYRNFFHSQFLDVFFSQNLRRKKYFHFWGVRTGGARLVGLPG